MNDKYLKLAERIEDPINDSIESNTSENVLRELVNDPPLFSYHLPEIKSLPTEPGSTTIEMVDMV